MDLDLLPKLLFVSIAAAVLWLGLRPRYIFMVRINAGRPQVAKGRVTATFLQQIGEACGRNGVVCGWIGGIRQQRRVVLCFSRGTPPPFRQQLRNLWPLHG